MAFENRNERTAFMKRKLNEFVFYLILKFSELIKSLRELEDFSLTKVKLCLRHVPCDR